MPRGIQNASLRGQRRHRTRLQSASLGPLLHVLNVLLNCNYNFNAERVPFLPRQFLDCFVQFSGEVNVGVNGLFVHQDNYVLQSD
jgi:hypothetical protein